MDCKECIFSIWLNDLQTGCMAARIEKLANKNKAKLIEEEGKSYYTLHQFCNMYRDQDWIDAANTKDYDELCEKALNEIKPLFGIVLHCNKENTIADITKTVESLASINYNADKIKIIISDAASHIDYMSIVHLTNIVKNVFPRSESIFHLHDDIALRDTECFKKIVQAMYFVKILAGNTIDPELFNKIHHIINYDLKQICMFESESTTIIMKKLITECYLEFNNYDLATEHIRNLCIKQDKYEKI